MSAHERSVKRATVTDRHRSSFERIWAAVTTNEAVQRLADFEAEAVAKLQWSITMGAQKLAAETARADAAERANITAYEELNVANEGIELLSRANAELRAEVAELRKDCERLDFLETEHGITINMHGQANIVRFEYEFLGQLRPAIDAALARKTGGAT